jgi:penicillin amidase
VTGEAAGADVAGTGVATGTGTGVGAGAAVGTGVAVGTGAAGVDWMRTDDESEAIGIGPTGGGAAATRCGLGVTGAAG